MTSNVVGSTSVPNRRTTISHLWYSSSRSRRYRQARPPLIGSTLSVHSGNRLRTAQTTAKTTTMQRTRNGVDRRPTLSGIATASSRSSVMNTVSHADSSLVLTQHSGDVENISFEKLFLTFEIARVLHTRILLIGKPLSVIIVVS